MNGKTSDIITPKSARPDYTDIAGKSAAEIWVDDNGFGVVVQISIGNIETKKFDNQIAILLTAPAAREIAKRINLLAAQVERRERSRAADGQLSLLSFDPVEVEPSAE